MSDLFGIDVLIFHVFPSSFTLVSLREGSLFIWFGVADGWPDKRHLTTCEGRGTILDDPAKPVGG